MNINKAAKKREIYLKITSQPFPASNKWKKPRKKLHHIKQETHS